MIKCLIFGLFLVVLLNSGLCKTNRGPCYTTSQAKCAQAWTNLWVAKTEEHLAKICQYFGDVHSCTTDYMSTCKFKSWERELYENDIVKIYTRKPYSCELIGGNMRYKGDYNSSRINKSELYPYLIIFFFYILVNKEI